jgi:hypothetical protein
MAADTGEPFGSHGGWCGDRGAAAAHILRRDCLTLLENNCALLIIFAGKLAGYFLGMANRRKAHRRRILKSGMIILGKEAHLPCSVRNLSEAGACLEVPATFGIPSAFLLDMPGRPPEPVK